MYLNNKNKQNFWKEPFDVHNLKNYRDQRGYLFEVLRFTDQYIPSGGQLYTFSIEPGMRRGDHYHNKKQEWFTCVSGEAIVLLSNKNDRKAIKISADKPKVVYAAPGTAHALINNSNKVAVIVSYGSKQHDPKDEDTFKQIAYQEFENSK